MPTVTRLERRKRGFFGTIFAILFWAFNAMMLVWMIAGLGATADQYGTLSNDAERAGAAIGATIGIGLVMFLWAIGAVILGLLMWATGGRKVIVETTTD